MYDGEMWDITIAINTNSNTNSNNASIDSRINAATLSKI